MPDVNRILWNERPVVGGGGVIDEIVLNDVKTVHIEQMSERCWWIGLYREDGTYWMGNFVVRGRRMAFVQQENAGVEWERDECHGEATSPPPGGTSPAR